MLCTLFPSRRRPLVLLFFPVRTVSVRSSHVSGICVGKSPKDLKIKGCLVSLPLSIASGAKVVRLISQPAVPSFSPSSPAFHTTI